MSTLYIVVLCSNICDYIINIEFPTKELVSSLSKIRAIPLVIRETNYFPQYQNNVIAFIHVYHLGHYKRF